MEVSSIDDAQRPATVDDTAVTSESKTTVPGAVDGKAGDDQSSENVGPSTTAPKREQESWQDALLLPLLQASPSHFDVVDSKHANSDQLRLWRKFALVRNSARRFRYASDLQQRDTKPAPPLQGSLRFRAGASAIKAVARFKSFLPRAADAALKEAKAEGFGISRKQLEHLSANQGVGELSTYGGAVGVAGLVRSDVEAGISGEEEDLARRVKVYGTNVLPEKPPKAYMEFVVDACQDMTLWILAVCAVMSLIVGVLTEGLAEGWYDGVGILLSIALVVFVTATSDYRQSLQFRLLDKEKKKVSIEVVRGKVRQKVPVGELVVGDVLALTAGDIIPADAIFITGHSMVVDESSMTGESLPVRKGRTAPFLLAGTKLQDGRGLALVVGVGTHTEWGRLMLTLSEATDDETPLQVKLNGVATLIGRVGLYVALLVFVVLMTRLLLSTPLSEWSFHHTVQVVDYFAVAVTIVVVAVPEGLPLAVTLSLAFAMQKMMRDRALVRKLAACETMGSATTICSDKTGTLTANQMTVVMTYLAGGTHSVPLSPFKLQGEPWSLPPHILNPLYQILLLNSSGDVLSAAEPISLLGSPTEQAMIAFGLRMGGNWQAVRDSEGAVVHEQPFSSERKCTGAAVRLPDGRVRVLWKGAAEIILACCTHTLTATSSKPVPLDQAKVQAVVEQYACNALRTLTLAYADLPAKESNDLLKAWGWKDPSQAGKEEVEEDVAAGAPVGAEGEEESKENLPAIPCEQLVLVGVVGIQDPLREEVKASVARCQDAGIKVRMVTGDNLSTAMAIARQCGILTPDGLAIEGPVFRALPQDKMREAALKLQVMARSSPTDKHLLVRTLRDMGDVVAVTGDGTNDAPALKEAEIGLAMGIAGTEVAKESADVIVMDDNFASIVNVAKWGRSVYTNIQKFVQFQLTVNIVALVTNFVSACFTGTAPLTAVQLLWVNLIMDTLGALALATEPPKEELMSLPPVGRRVPFVTPVMWRNIFGQALFQLTVLALLGSVGEYIFFLSGPQAAGIKRTLLFNTFVFCQLFNEINSREMEETDVFKDILSNYVFLSVMIFSTAFQIFLVQVLSKFASTVPLTTFQFVACIAIASLSMPVAVAVKKVQVPTFSVPVSRAKEE